MTHRHTAGTWRVAAGPTFCAIRTDDRVIADIRLVGLHYNKADAALIAAAPDFLKALEDVLMVFSEEFSDSPTLERARAAIAKATQEPTP